MKQTTVRTPQEYLEALKAIILNETAGIIQVEQPNKNNEIYLHSAFKTSDNNYVIFSTRIYSFGSDKTKMEDRQNLELVISGIYTDGYFLNTGYALCPAQKEFENAIPTKIISDISKTIAEKVSAYIADSMKKEYPDYLSIPDDHKLLKETSHDENLTNILKKQIQTEAQTLLLQGEKAEDLAWRIEILPAEYYYPTTIINYEHSIANHTEHEFIKEKAEQYLAKEQYGKTYKNRILNDLSKHYLLKTALKQKQENIDPESVTYLAIKEKLDTFLEKNQNCKKIKLYIAGKNFMIKSNTHKKYQDFSIEGKTIEITCEPNKFKRDFEQNNRLKYWNFEITVPKLKEMYSNRNENYLEEIYPSYIDRITYGRNTIYQKE